MNEGARPRPDAFGSAYTIELGTWFFENCADFESTILPDNRSALIYAAKVARTPYLTPAGPEITGISKTATVVATGIFNTQSGAVTGVDDLMLPAGAYDTTATSDGHGSQSVLSVAALPGVVSSLDFVLAPYETVFEDNVESGNLGWTTEGQWAITDEASASPNHSWTDSPGSHYGNYWDNSLVSPALDFSGVAGVALEFSHTYDLESGFDYAHVEISSDGGATWSPVATYNGVQSFEDPAVMPGSPYWGTTTVAPDGTVFVAGVAQSGPLPIVVARSTTAQDPNAPLVFDGSASLDLGGDLVASIGYGPNPGGLLGQIWIAADHSGGLTDGNLYLVASADPPGSDPVDVHFSRSTDGGQTWSAPVRLNDDPAGNNAWQWFATLAVAPDGRIDVVWNDTRNAAGGTDSELFYSFSTNGGQSWSPNQTISPAFNPTIGWPNQDKIGDYYEMISDRVGADLAWSATFNGEQDVDYLRIGDRDCNDNGIGDSTEGDGDGDGIFDDCDNCPTTANPRQTDSDFNGLGNACDTFMFGDGFEWGSDAAWSGAAP